MIVTHDREKLIQAVNFFAQNTRKCGKTKLYKLLYFLDFEHFRATGRSVTGMQYFAWPMGPVPVALHDEIPQPKPDMAAVVEFEEIPLKNGNLMLSIRPSANFSGEHFSRRELQLMESLAKEYRHADAEQMVEKTHLENLPWDKIYIKEGRKQAEIPYYLAVRSDEMDLVLGVAADRKDLLARLT